MKRILDCLPPLYGHLLPPLFRQLIPAEDLSTCRRCAMCRRPGQPWDPVLRYFRPDVRCCSYYPSLPNYLVGALLADRSPRHDEGRRRVRRLLARPKEATPFGLEAPRARELRYTRLGDEAFGRLRSLRCPYFRMGSNDCSIWGFRSGTCATYFCSPARGIHGAAFWEAVHRYLRVLEKALAQHALHALHATDSRAGRDAYSREALYRQAYAAVASLTPRQVASIAGEPGRAALRKVRAHRRKMLSDSIPRRLRTNAGLLVLRRRDEVLLIVPGHLVFGLSHAVWEALRGFDGRRDRESVVEEVRRSRGLELTRGFLLALYRAGILEEGGTAGHARARRRLRSRSTRSETRRRPTRAADSFDRGRRPRYD